MPLLWILAALVLIALAYREQAPMTYSAAIVAFAKAIAQTEGFGVGGAIPTVCHNPGDLTKGDFGDTGVYRTAAGGEQIIVFASDTDGWNALYRKLQAIVDGHPSVYNVNQTFYEFASHYAPGAQAQPWAQDVASILGADPSEPVGDYLA